MFPRCLPLIWLFTLLTAQAQDVIAQNSGTERSSSVFPDRHESKAACEVLLHDCHPRDPCVVLWLSEDPIGEEGGINLYAYVRNGPVGAFDPDGLSPESDAWWSEFWKGLKRTITDPELWKEKLTDAAARRPGRCVFNSKHHPNSRSPAPKNWADLYKKSIPDKDGVRWAKDENGILHRFSKPRNGECHWNGSTGGNEPIERQNIPNDILKIFGL